MLSWIVKFGICLCLVALTFLLSKGFSYSLPNTRPINQSLLKNTTCNEIATKKECRPCSSYEMKSQKKCLETGNIEEVSCKNPKMDIMESCPLAVKAELKKFWVFEASVASVAVVSSLFVWWRRRLLDGVKYQRLKRQISDAV